MKKYFFLAMVLTTLKSQSQIKFEPINVNFFQIISNSSNYNYYNNAYT